MNIINKKHVATAVKCAEGVHRLVCDMRHHVIGEILTFGVDHLDIGIGAAHLVDHGVHQVCFTYTRRTVNEQGVIFFYVCVIRHFPTNRTREAIGISHDEVIKRVFRKLVCVTGSRYVAF